MATQFPRLFEPIEVGQLTLKNRLFSAGYALTMSDQHHVTDQMVAYYDARARGGIALMISQAIAVHHESGFYTAKMLHVDGDEYIEGLARLAEVCHQNDCLIFGQLFHVGCEGHASADGGPAQAFGPSPRATEMYHSWSQEMSPELIEEVITAYGAGAARFQRAGFDGAELLASHGYLPAQFLNPNINLREDEHGGSFENRLRFVRRVISEVKTTVSNDFVVGMRISEEMDHDGLNIETVVEVCQALDSDGELDYYNICVGSESTYRGASQLNPPMGVDQGHVAPLSRQVREVVDKPVLVVGRINDPQIADRILEREQADMCGMARALVCDPELPKKTQEGRVDDVRVCIGCNQACIGHSLIGAPVSCIQHPESGRELIYKVKPPAAKSRRVLVVGGGPAGMKAAAVAAERGHSVTLFERGPQLGGQALLAQLLPTREEFGGIAQNLSRDLHQAGVDVRMKTEVTRALIEAERPDVVVLATGAKPRIPDIEGAADGHVVTAWQILKREVEVGNRVLVADWRGDWVAPGVAELLARSGHNVRIAVPAPRIAEKLEQATGFETIGRLFQSDVEVIPNARLFGIDADTVYLQHTITDDPIVCEDVDTLVLAMGHEPDRELTAALTGFEAELISIGDCRVPRTAEEAVLEGLEVGCAL